MFLDNLVSLVRERGRTSKLIQKNLYWTLDSELRSGYTFLFSFVENPSPYSFLDRPVLSYYTRFFIFVNPQRSPYDRSFSDTTTLTR